MRNVILWVTFWVSLSAFSCLATPIPANKLFASPALSNLQFSPDEQYLAGEIIDERGRFLSLINLSINEYSNVIKLDKDEQITEYEWLDDSNIYIRYARGNTSSQLVLYVYLKEGVVHSKIHRLPYDGALVSVQHETGKLLYGYRSQTSQYQKLYSVTVEQLKNKGFSAANLVDDKLRKAYGYFFDNVDNMLFALTLDEDDERVDFHYRRLNEANWHPLFSLSSGKESFLPQKIIDDNTMYVLSNQDTDKVALYKFDIKNQRITDLVYEHPKFDLTGSTFDKDNQLLSVSFYENGQQSTHYFDPSANEKQSVFSASFPNKHTLVTTTSRTGKYSALYVYASDDPGARYVYNNDKNTAFLLSKVLPDLTGYALSKTQAFTVESDTGVAVEAYLTLPQANSANGVLLVMPHGGPVGVRDYNNFNPESQYFASRGFAVLRVNFRGSVGYGKAFLKSGVGQFGLAIEKDITAAVNHIRSKYQFDRSCAIGASYGGYSSMMLAIKHPEQYQCVVGAYGIYDLPLLFNSSNVKTTDEFRQMTANAVGEYRAELKETSPVYLSDKIKVPVLLIAGEDDMTAELEHSQRLEYVLKARGNAPETLYYKKTGHGHSSWYWQQHEAVATAEFLRRSLSLVEYESAIKDNKSQLSALAEDYLLLGDARNWESKVELNKGLAMEYYLRAAKMGSGRANFLVGAKHYDNKEKAAALPWFEKAAATGYATGNYTLGIIYSDKDEATFDPAKAFHYFELADEQGADARARLKMAKALCLGDGVEKNISRCTELLALSELKASAGKLAKNEVTKASLTLQKETVAEIFAEADFSVSELQQLQQLLEKEFKITLKPYQLDDIEAGIITENRGKNEVNAATALAFNPGDLIGGVFEVDVASTLGNVGLSCNWSYQDLQGKRVSLHDHLLWSAGDDGQWSCTHKMTSDNQSTGTYVLTLRDMTDKVVLVREFTLTQ